MHNLRSRSFSDVPVGPDPRDPWLVKMTSKDYKKETWSAQRLKHLLFNFIDILCIFIAIKRSVFERSTTMDGKGSKDTKQGLCCLTYVFLYSRLSVHGLGEVLCRRSSSMTRGHCAAPTKALNKAHTKLIL